MGIYNWNDDVRIIQAKGAGPKVQLSGLWVQLKDCLDFGES
jgi:hypothetical protein